MPKFLTVNPDLATRITDLAQANPIEATFVASVLLMVACWFGKEFI